MNLIICAYDTVAKSSDIFAQLSNLTPTNQEEGDTRVLLHMKDMILKGCKKIVIRTVDTDVLVLALSIYEEVYVEGLELWVDFGVGKNRENFPINHMFNMLGSEKAAAIRFFIGIPISYIKKKNYRPTHFEFLGSATPSQNEQKWSK